MHALPIITHDHDGSYYSRFHKNSSVICIFRLCFSWHEKGSKDAPILEHHVSEWVDMYNAGFGVMGEQGTEAIHNQLYRTYG